MKTGIFLFVVTITVMISKFAVSQSAGPKLKVAHISILVHDYDQGLKYYTDVLGFEKKTDIKFGNERWITIAAPGEKGIEFVLVRAKDKEDSAIVGNQAGARTFAVLNTNDCKKVFADYKLKGIKVLTEPRETPWGVQAQFYDLYGNRFVLLEPNSISQNK
ncbi:MAG: VOC family protein [Chitinophagaceae bacterium]|nr:VOC family protein [Chitinophagaceae bacterium]